MARNGEAGQDQEWLGVVWQGRLGEVMPGWTVLGVARRDKANNQGLTWPGMWSIMVIESANSISQVFFLVKTSTTVYISGCNKSPLVDPTQKKPVRVGAPARSFPGKVGQWTFFIFAISHL